jgi:hypothetical protein
MPKTLTGADLVTIMRGARFKFREIHEKMVELKLEPISMGHMSNIQQLASPCSDEHFDILLKTAKALVPEAFKQRATGRRKAG